MRIKCSGARLLHSVDKFSLKWCVHHTILPTPFLRSDGTLRIFYAGTDDKLIGRIGYFDVDPDNPSKIIHTGADPILEPKVNTFYENGLNPIQVIRKSAEVVLMTFVGYRTGSQTPYELFTGLAVSRDDGATFVVEQDRPIISPGPKDTIKSALCFMDNTLTSGVYVGSKRWNLGTENSYPEYELYSVEMNPDMSERTSYLAINRKEGEIGLGRPYIFNYGKSKLMMFSCRKIVQFRPSYFAFGAALLVDNSWVRLDNINFRPSGEYWDSQMYCYASVIESNNSFYLFYNGNGNGRGGIGYAKLEFQS